MRAFQKEATMNTNTECEALRAALRELVRQVEISNAVDDHGTRCAPQGADRREASARAIPGRLKFAAERGARA
jgi:hypothetical protein